MKIQSHRGNSEGFVENTLEAFENVIAHGVRSIETDVHMTKDKVLVLHHDFQLGRIFEGKEKITDLTFSEIQQRSCLISGHDNLRIPSFKETLAVCVTHQIQMNLEFKVEAFHDYQEIVAQVLHEIHDQQAEAWVYFSSFHYPLLAYLKKLSPNSEVYWLLEQNIPGLFDYVKPLGLDGIHLDIKVWKDLGPSEKQDLLAVGGLRLWTVNSVEDKLLAESDGVPEIITNYSY